jgi:hypothetical protein
MIALIFTACLMSAPERCEAHRLAYADMSPMACLAVAQQELARWAGDHPGRRIRDWRCDDRGRSDDGI